MSNNIYTHKHHIVPKHMGGTDDPSNLIKLTVAEHTEAHKKLYEEHGHWQDKLAWQGLAGIIGKEEIILAIQRRPKSKETRDKISAGGMYNTNALGAVRSKESKDKLRALYLNVTLSEEHKANIRAGMSRVELVPWNKGQTGDKHKIVQCPHCNKTGGDRAMTRWHFNNCKSYA